MTPEKRKEIRGITPIQQDAVNSALKLVVEELEKNIDSIQITTSQEARREVIKEIETYATFLDLSSVHSDDEEHYYHKHLLDKLNLLKERIAE